VIDHSHQHFDAPRSASALGSAMSLMWSNWRVLLALTATAALVELLAAGLLCLDAIGSRALDASVGSISILVVVDSQASQADVDALGPLIRAVPGIGEATFRPKDEAIKALVAKGLPPADGRNPLPDVWVGRFDAAATGADRSVVTAVAEARRLLGNLPHVESATADEAWVRAADRWVDHWRRARPFAWAGSLVVLSLILACAAFLAGCSLNEGGELSVRVLAFVAVPAAMIASAIGCSTDWLLLDRLNVAAGGALQITFGQVFAARPGAATAALAASWLILAAGLMVGRRSTE
jgi:hypothetical protein